MAAVKFVLDIWSYQHYYDDIFALAAEKCLLN